MLLFRVIDPEDLKAELFIPADRLSGVRIGQPVVARPDSGPERALEGRIVSLSPVIDPKNGTCRAVALFPGAGKVVRPGTVARISPGETETTEQRKGAKPDG
jgi:multidrug efflux pump subunit AcrA (membrane-fusion protein)